MVGIVPTRIGRCGVRAVVSAASTSAAGGDEMIEFSQAIEMFRSLDREVLPGPACVPIPV